MTDKNTLKERKDNLENFLSELLPALEELAQAAGINDSKQILIDPWSTSRAISVFLDQSRIAQQKRTWYVARVGFYIGELIKWKFGGCWYVNESTTSRYYGRYVVGEFSKISASGVSVDPFEAASDYFELPPPRQFSRLVSEMMMAIEGV